MDTRVALIGIIVENMDSTPEWNYGGKSRFYRNDEPYFA